MFRITNQSVSFKRYLALIKSNKSSKKSTKVLLMKKTRILMEKTTLMRLTM